MPKKSDTILCELLTQRGLLTSKDEADLLKEADTSGKSVLELVCERGLMQEREILTLLSQKLKLEFVALAEYPAERGVAAKVNVKIASYYRFVPLKLKGRLLTIAVSSPLDIKTQDEIRTQLGFDLELVLVTAADVQEGLRRIYGVAADTIDRLYAGEKDTAPPSGGGSGERIEDIERLAGDASVINLVNQIILEAFRKRATDIHIEPYRETIALRYRVDGILYDAPVAPEIKNYLNAIISRIKIMSNLNIVERRLPQDGRAIVKVGEQMLDLRISTIPTPFGESVVIRILPTQMLFSLEKLGLPRQELQIFEDLIKKPHGIIFVTGPTGSGKTTTLYACLSRINTKDRKIITIEDPIEYEMSGITQIQVQPEIGLDFARGLRSILRHDPDVIMVGEVRDLETAEIAIRVALTGHLVFSTLHTNDAASGVTRLVDIGVEPYLLASSVQAFIAQRLIRTICPHCKYEDTDASLELRKMIARDSGISSPQDIRLYRGKGCSQCNGTGFFGRTAIYEILLVNEGLRELILKKSTSAQIARYAFQNGMRTLRQDGWQKVKNGLTTPEEVLKVAPAEEYAVAEGPAPAAAAPEQEGPASGRESRLFMRLNFEATLHFKRFRPSAVEQEELARFEELSITKNLSAGGLLFVANEQFSIGDILQLKIELPDGPEPVECLGKVVRIESGRSGGGLYSIAVCFLDITGAQRARLKKFVEREVA